MRNGAGARYGIVTLIWPDSLLRPHPTPVRVRCGREFRHTTGEPALGPPFGQGPAGMLHCLR
jgi:hypothetical protein